MPPLRDKMKLTAPGNWLGVVAVPEAWSGRAAGVTTPEVASKFCGCDGRKLGRAIRSSNVDIVGFIVGSEENTIEDIQSQ